MANGVSRPALFTESNCHSGRDLINALTCDICKDLFWECQFHHYERPHSLVPCNHNFCQQCLAHAKSNAREEGWGDGWDEFRCPKCRQPVYETELVPSLDHTLVNILDQLEFSCVNEGCQEKVAWGKMSAHKMHCKFKMVKCEWCTVLHRPCEKAAHLEICSNFWKSKCKDPQMKSLVVTACRWCGKRIQLQNELEHFDNCVLRWKKKYDQLKRAGRVKRSRKR